MKSIFAKGSFQFNTIKVDELDLRGRFTGDLIYSINSILKGSFSIGKLFSSQTCEIFFGNDCNFDAIECAILNICPIEISDESEINSAIDFLEDMIGIRIPKGKFVTKREIHVNTVKSNTVNLKDAHVDFIACKKLNADGCRIRKVIYETECNLNNCNDDVVVEKIPLFIS